MTANIDATAPERDASVAPQAAVNEGFVVQPAALPAPKADAGLLAADPELYAAWREHVRAGFEQNSTMFRRILDAFMEPYHTTIWMYRILFGLGVLAFVAAIVVSVWLREPLFALVFGGLSIGAFVSYFVSRPIQALEENLQLITWLGVIYNSYWTSLAPSRTRTACKKSCARPRPTRLQRSRSWWTNRAGCSASDLVQRSRQTIRSSRTSVRNPPT